MANMTYGSLALAARQTSLIADEAKEKATINVTNSNYYRDDAQKYFKNLSEMLSFLNEREGVAYWERGVITKGLRLILLEESRCQPTEAYHDTLKQIGLALSMEANNLTQTPLRSCAIPSLQDRARISGGALATLLKVSKEVYKGILNDCFAIADKRNCSLIRIADGKISAVLSNDYKPIGLPDIFEAATNYITTRFTKNAFAGGSWSHSFTMGEWSLTGEKTLISTYTDALKRHDIQSGEIEPGIRLFSSDIGTSGVNLLPKLVVHEESMLLPLGGPICMEHKGDADMDKFVENLEMLFSQYSQRLSGLTALLDVEIDYPEACMAKIMKRLKIPKKYGDQALDTFLSRLGDKDCTAHDIYYGLGGLLFILQSENASGEKILRMEENIAKALALNFKDYDYPVSI